MSADDFIKSHFKNNNLDISYFNVEGFNRETTIFKAKIQSVQLSNEKVNYEPIFSHNQKRKEQT